MPQPTSIHYRTMDRAGELQFADLTRPVIEFLSMFGTSKSDRVAMVGVQRATPELKRIVADFCETYRRQEPRIGGFAKLIRDLADNEAFLILRDAPRSSREQVHQEDLLALLNGTATVDAIDAVAMIFDPLFAEYDISSPRTDRYTLIGPKRKDRRKCRLCGETIATGATFGDDAHAIPVALGNHFLFLADECDACNSYFGDVIESHLIRLLDVPRVMLGIKGRGKHDGRPEVVMQDGKAMFHDGEKVVIEAYGDIVEVVDREFLIALPGGIIPERVYRALAKIALSVMPEDHLPDLTETVRWVRYGVPADTQPLPMVRYRFVDLPPNPSAQIALYIRRSKSSRLPHVVGEFRLGGHVHVFLLPFSSRDSGDLAFFGDPQFMNLFRHYAGAGEWRAITLSSTSAGGMRILRIGPDERPANEVPGA